MQLSALSTLSVRVIWGLGYSRKPFGVESNSVPVILFLGYHPFDGEAIHEHRYSFDCLLPNHSLSFVYLIILYHECRCYKREGTGRAG